jgi:hypothetical protein
VDDVFSLTAQSTAPEDSADLAMRSLLEIRSSNSGARHLRPLTFNLPDFENLKINRSLCMFLEIGRMENAFIIHTHMRP